MQSVRHEQPDRTIDAKIGTERAQRIASTLECADHDAAVKANLQRAHETLGTIYPTTVKNTRIFHGKLPLAE
jgi:hypothetical protein